MALSEVEVKEKSSFRSFLNFFLPGAASLFLIFSPWLYGLRHLPDKLFAQTLIFALSSATFPFLKWKNVLNRGSRKLDRWVFASLALGFCYILISVIPSLSFLAFLQLAGCVSLYVLIRSASTQEKEFLFFLSSIVFCGVFYAAYGLFQYYGFLPHPYWFEGWFLASRFINGGHFGVFLLTPFFMAGSLMLSTRKLFLRGVLALSLLVMGWAFLLTHSRAPWLVLAFGSCFFLWVLKRNHLLSRKEILGVSFFLGTSLGLMVLSGGMKEIVSRFGQMWGKTSVIFDPHASGQFYTVFYRLRLWQESLAAILARPWGWGLGTFENIFPQFRTHSDRFRIDYAHNEILQIGVDLGIIGLLFLAGFLIYYFKRMGNFLRSPVPSRSYKIYAAGLMTAVASLFLVSQVDFPLRVYANSFFFAAVLALSSSLFGLLPPHSKSEREMPVFFQPLLRIGLPALLAVLTFFSAREYLAQTYYSKAIELDKNFEWSKALTEYERAVGLSPLRSEYYEGLGGLLQKKETLSFNRKEKKRWGERALWAYEEAVKRNPYQAFSHYRLALIYQNKGNPEEAKKQFKKAISLEPLNAAYVSEYGLFALKNKWKQQGLWAFEKYTQIPFKENARFTTIPELLEAVYPYTTEYLDLTRMIPNTADGHYQLGTFLGTKGRWESADQELEKAIKAAKRQGGPFSEYWTGTAKPVANFYFSQNRLDQAQKLYQEAVKKNPHDTESINQLQQIEQMKKPSVPQVTL